MIFVLTFILVASLEAVTIHKASEKHVESSSETEKEKTGETVEKINN